MSDWSKVIVWWDSTMDVTRPNFLRRCRRIEKALVQSQASPMQIERRVQGCTPEDETTGPACVSLLVASINYFDPDDGLPALSSAFEGHEAYLVWQSESDRPQLQTIPKA